MANRIISISATEEDILKELRCIRDKFEELKRMHQLQYDNDEIKQLKARMNTMIHCPISLKTETALMKTEEFQQLATSIRKLDFEFTHFDEFYWSKELQYENSLESEKSAHHRAYVDEIKIDLELLARATTKPIEQIAFIGSGPLPLTSITLLRESRTLKKIINIDCDHTAIELSKSLARYNELDNKMEFVECFAEALTAKQIENCQLVLLAILVGHDRESKIEIFRHLYKIMSDGMLILVRTGRGLKQIVYPPIEMTDLNEIGFKPIFEFHPYGQQPLTITKLIAEK